ncbi:MAG: PEGA domain-containing protein [Treponema sp.]|nr:PEGA domain-containing protein [Treponema sp.]
MKKLFAFAVVANLLAAFLFAQEARNALLIANEEYSTEIGKLKTPIQEAEALKVVLDELGFDTVIVKNAERTEINKILYEFKAKTENEGGIAFFHYGGHAVQCNGTNYILPVGLKQLYDEIISSEGKPKLTFEERVLLTLENEAIKSDTIMNSMNAEANIIILDSCRNSPFTDGKRGIVSRGLALTAMQPKNSIIVYSAEPGKTASDGVFTPILTQKIAEKGKSFTDILIETRNSVLAQTNEQQQPGEYVQLRKAIYLAGENAVSYDLKKTVATGSISVISEFPGKIYLDGNYQSDISAFETVVLEDVATARYKLEIEGKNTSDNQSKYIVVKKNEESSILFKVVTGSIEITSEIAGEVYIDKQNYGKILSGETHIVNNIPAAHYTVEVRGEGNEVLSGAVTVASNETAKVSLERNKTSADKESTAPKKNIFSVKDIDGFSFGIETFYNFSWFSIGSESIFATDKGFGANIFPFSMLINRCRLKIGGGYTYSDSKIGKEALAFHEADWLLFGVGADFSRLAFTLGFGLSTIWEDFSYEVDENSYKTKKAKFCMPFPVTIYFRIGKNLLLFGEYKPTLFVNDILFRHSGNVGMRLDFYY